MYVVYEYEGPLELSRGYPSLSQALLGVVGAIVGDKASRVVLGTDATHSIGFERSASGKWGIISATWAPP